MSEPMEVTVNLTDDKVQFTGALRDNPAVQFDYYPPVGYGQGYTPLEMFLMSLGVCSGTAIIALLRKMRKSVTGFSVSARGTRRETHPTSFEQIYLDFTIHSTDAIDADVQKALRLAEDSICPVWAMIKGNVEVIAAYKIVAGEGALAAAEALQV